MSPTVCTLLLLSTSAAVTLRFASDTDAELELVRTLSLAAGATAAVVANHWAEGGAGAVDLGAAVIDACATARADPAFEFK
jgi:formyltetrahydrofolate synthetase